MKWEYGKFKGWDIKYWMDNGGHIHIVPLNNIDNFSYMGSNKVISGKIYFTYCFSSNILINIIPLIKINNLKIL